MHGRTACRQFQPIRERAEKNPWETFVIVMLCILAAVAIVSLIIGIVALVRTDDHEVIVTLATQSAAPPSMYDMSGHRHWRGANGVYGGVGAANPAKKLCDYSKGPCMYTNRYMYQIAEEADNYIEHCIGNELMFFWGAIGCADLKPFTPDIRYSSTDMNTCNSICANITALYAAMNTTKSPATTMELVTAYYITNECKMWMGLYVDDWHYTYYQDPTWGYAVDPLQGSAAVASYLPDCATDPESNYDVVASEYVVAMPTKIENAENTFRARYGYAYDPAMLAEKYLLDATDGVEYPPFCQSSTYYGICDLITDPSAERDACMAALTTIDTKCDSLVSYLETDWIPGCQTNRPNSNPGLGYSGNTDGKDAFRYWWNGIMADNKPFGSTWWSTYKTQTDAELAILKTQAATILSVSWPDVVTAVLDLNDERFWIKGDISVAHNEAYCYYSELMSQLARGVHTMIGYIPPVATELRLVDIPMGVFIGSGMYDPSAGAFQTASRLMWSPYVLDDNDTQAVWNKYNAPAMMASMYLPGFGVNYITQTMISGVPGVLWVPSLSGPNSGWSEYAQQMVANYTNYYSTDETKLGSKMLTVERAIRAIVDTGMNYGIMSVDTAKAYYTDAGFSDTYAESQVRRFLTWPSSGSIHYGGAKRYLELRNKYEALFAANGLEFSLQVFHKLVTGMGTPTWNVMDQILNTWLQMELKNCAAKTMPGACTIKEIAREPVIPSVCSYGKTRAKDWCFK